MRRFEIRFKSDRASPNSWSNSWGTQERLGICLYRLNRSDYHHTIAEMTGRGLTTGYCITQEVCNVIVSNLWSEFVNFPETVDQCSQQFPKWRINDNFPVHLMEWMADMFQWNVLAVEMKQEKRIKILKKNFLSLWWVLLELTTSFYGLLLDYRVVQTTHVLFRLLV